RTASVPWGMNLLYRLLPFGPFALDCFCRRPRARVPGPRPAPPVTCLGGARVSSRVGRLQGRRRCSPPVSRHVSRAVRRFSGLASIVLGGGIVLAQSPFADVPRVAARAAVSTQEAILRYTDPPHVALTPAGPEWRAAVDCAPPVALPSLIGARVGFTYDFDLDGITEEADAADSLGISPADCRVDGESAPGRIPLRRRLAPQGGDNGDAAVLRADLVTAADSVAARHVLLTKGSGSLLRIVRYCARPRHGEPEWIEVRNVSARPLALTQVRLEGRAVSGAPSLRLAPGASFLAAGDTAGVRVWQPGHHVVALSSWSNLRNSGDTLRLTLTGPPATDL